MVLFLSIVITSAARNLLGVAAVMARPRREDLSMAEEAAERSKDEFLVG
jgi:hypothetical protein